MSFPSKLTRPFFLEKCKSCSAKFIPTIDVEDLPVFNSVDKSRWSETACPKCTVRYRIARLSKSSFDVCVILSEKLPRRAEVMEDLVPAE
jgi:hypothetical protein